MSQSQLVVLDTNVVVSAQLSPMGPPGCLWDLVMARQIRLAHNDQILWEYETVLRRPKFAFPTALVEAVMTAFVLQESVEAFPWPHGPLPDPRDAPFLEVAHAAGCPLITGNIRHFPESLRGSVQVFSPGDFLASWRIA